MEFYTGNRACSRELLERLPLEPNSDDFVFDNQLMAETAWLGCAVVQTVAALLSISGAKSKALERPTYRNIM